MAFLSGSDTSAALSLSPGANSASAPALCGFGAIASAASIPRRNRSSAPGSSSILGDFWFMTTAEYGDARREYLIHLGESLIAWNQAEMVLRGLLTRLCGEGLVSLILTAELGSQGMVDALRSISPLHSKEFNVAINTIAKYYETLRAYRNYYFHGLIAVSSGIEIQKASGLLNVASSKGKLGVATQNIPLSEIDTLRSRCETLMGATGDLIDLMFPQEGSRVNPPLPTPESLPPPPTLKKQLRYPLNDPPQQPSSGG